MNTWICGNSHLAALRNGYSNIDSPKSQLKFFPFGSGKWTWEKFSKLGPKGISFLPDEFKNNLFKATQTEYLDSSDIWGICIGGHSPRLYGSPIWKWCRPSHLATESFRPISLGVIDALIANDHKYIYQFFSQLKSAKLKFFVIATPPPPENFHGGDRLDETETIAFVENRARNQFVAWVKENGIDYVDLPKGVCDTKGFIKKKYKLQFMHDGRRDGHHANEIYGELMVTKIIKYLSGKREGFDIQY